MALWRAVLAAEVLVQLPHEYERNTQNVEGSGATIGVKNVVAAQNKNQEPKKVNPVLLGH